jgi:oligopeptidase B
MLDVDDQEFLDYLTAENTYSDAYFEPHAEVIETLYSEIKSRVQESDMSTPVRNGDWWYVTRTEEGLSYPVHHRGPTIDAATDVVLFDENIESAGHDYFDLGALDASHDHKSFAWSIDTAG